jgi:uncharacterized protein
MTDTTYNKPIPDLDDPDMAPFWANARDERLTAQRCTNCQSLRFPALPVCPVCQDLGFEWVDVSTSGTVWSFVVYHRAFHPGFKEDLPYAVAVVENADGVCYTGMIVGDRTGLKVGAPVRAVFEKETPEFTLVKWELADS